MFFFLSYLKAICITLAYTIYLKICKPASFEYLFLKSWYKKQLSKEDVLISNAYFLFYHYMKFGHKRNLSPHPFFNTQLYKERYGAEFKEETNPLSHFIKNGKNIRYSPCTFFDPIYYTSKYQINTTNEIPLVHFLKYGANLGYSPNLSFDKIKNIEPAVSFRSFSHNVRSVAYNILDKNKNIEAFSVVLEQHIQVKPDLFFILSADKSTECESLINNIAPYIIEHNLNILIFQSNHSKKIKFDDSLQQYTKVFSTKELNISLNRKRILILLIRLLIQLKPSMIHFFDTELHSQVIDEVGKQISTNSKVSVSQNITELTKQIKDNYFTKIFSSGAEVLSNQSLPPKAQLHKNRQDITVIMNVHNEGSVIEQSFLSLYDCIEYARSKEIAVEWIVIADNPSKAITDFFNNIQRGDFRFESVSFRDLSLSRNYGALLAKGKYIAFFDGDDLWTSNWLTEAYNLSEKTDKEIICHPEASLYFQEKNHILFHTDSQAIDFNKWQLIESNYWTSQVFLKTQTYIDNQQIRLNIDNGFGYEDWEWNCNTLAKGIAHKIILNSFHFIRSHKQSLSVISKNNNCILPPVSLFNPNLIHN